MQTKYDASLDFSFLMQMLFTRMHVDAQFCPSYCVYFHSGPRAHLVMSVEFGPRTLSVFKFIESLSRFCISCLFCVYLVFNCYLSFVFLLLNMFRIFNFVSCYVSYVDDFRSLFYFVFVLFYVFVLLVYFHPFWAKLEHPRPIQRTSKA